MVEEYSKQTGGRSLAEAQDVIQNGHPPIADKVALIDFDGTLYPFGYLFDFPDPIPGAVEFMQALARQGYKIVIFTSRLSPTWLASVNQEPSEHVAYISTILKRDGIPFDRITSEKIPAEFYLDDKAIGFSPAIGYEVIRMIIGV